MSGDLIHMLVTYHSSLWACSKKTDNEKGRFVVGGLTQWSGYGRGSGGVPQRGPSRTLPTATVGSLRFGRQRLYPHWGAPPSLWYFQGPLLEGRWRKPAQGGVDPLAV